MRHILGERVDAQALEGHMRTPGVEPGSQAWEACMMPLHYVRPCGRSDATRESQDWLTRRGCKQAMLVCQAMRI